MYDIIIVGAGPAGLTAAIYALRAKKKVLLLEARCYGGQITNANLVQNYPGFESISGVDLATEMYNQVVKLGAEIKYETVLKLEDNVVFTKNNEYKAKAIILATGADKTKLNIEREDEFIGKGLSYCATCDGNFFKEKIIALVGNGKEAVEDAIYLSNIVSKLYIISKEDLKDSTEMDSESLNKENIEIIYNSSIDKLYGENKIESIDIKNSNGNITNLKVDGLFVSVGQEPKNQIFANIIELDSNGYIKTEDGIHTSKPKIYVAGDARAKFLRQLVTATADGAIAATTAIKEMED